MSLATIARTRTRSKRCSFTPAGKAVHSIWGIQAPNRSREISRRSRSTSVVGVLEVLHPLLELLEVQLRECFNQPARGG